MLTADNLGFFEKVGLIIFGDLRKLLDMVPLGLGHCHWSNHQSTSQTAKLFMENLEGFTHYPFLCLEKEYWIYHIIR